MIANRVDLNFACECVTNTLRSEFPNFLIDISIVSILGELPRIMIANVPSKKDAPYGILENCSVFMKGLIQVDHTGKAYMDNAYYCRNIKFRKINGKDEIEVLTKFCTWMVKNRDMILAIEPRFNNQ